MKYPTYMNPLRRRGRLGTALAVGALLSLPVVSEAVHWPQFGGDAGHSGNQPVQQATMPTEFLYTVGGPGTEAGSPRTSLVTTAGPSAADQFVAYGKWVDVANTTNDEGRIHIRSLEDGTEKVLANQQNVDDAGEPDDDVFGPAPGGVTPVDSSSSGGPGQLYVIHNDNNSAAKTPNPDTTFTTSFNDIAIAQFDEATGAQKQDVAIGRARDLPDEEFNTVEQVSAGYTIESSPVITPPLDAGGKRIIFFIAKKDTAGAPRLFGVTVDNAGSPNAVINSDNPQTVDVADANTKASPSLVYLRDADRAADVLYVAVAINGAAAPDVKTFQVDDIGDPNENGPALDAAQHDFPGVPQTISVPVTESGMLPGQSGSGVSKAPAMYVAFGDDKGTPDKLDDTTTVRKFVQQADSNKLVPAPQTQPTSVEGYPAPALAVSALASGTGEAAGRVVLTTSRNVILLNSETVTPVDRLRDANETLFDPTMNQGFARNTAAVSGNFIFATNDDGAQFVLNISDAERVASSDFSENTANNTSDLGLGQPSISRGFLQFFSDRGLFVYKTGVIIPPPPANDAPIASFTASPNPAKPGETVSFDGSGSSDPDGSIANYAWDLDGNGSFETDTGTTPTTSTAYPTAGTYNVKLRVTDAGNPAKSTIVSKDVVISDQAGNRPPTASFTITPSPARTGQPVTFNGAASSDPDGPVTRFEWDLDGNGSYETNSGTNPTTTRTYTVGGILNIRLRVTDAGGLSAETIRQLVIAGPGGNCAVNRCRAGITARVSPSRDRTLPYRFIASGRITRPSGLSASDGCRGRVSVQYKRGRRTVSSRRTSVRSNCTFRLRTSFRDRKRLGTSRSLRVTVRFQGNSFLLPRTARTRTVRLG